MLNVFNFSYTTIELLVTKGCFVLRNKMFAPCGVVQKAEKALPSGEENEAERPGEKTASVIFQFSIRFTRAPRLAANTRDVCIHSPYAN